MSKTTKAYLAASMVMLGKLYNQAKEKGDTTIQNRCTALQMRILQQEAKRNGTNKTTKTKN
jgi:hypothetical protein